MYTRVSSVLRTDAVRTRHTNNNWHEPNKFASLLLREKKKRKERMKERKRGELE